MNDNWHSNYDEQTIKSYNFISNIKEFMNLFNLNSQIPNIHDRKFFRI